MSWSLKVIFITVLLLPILAFGQNTGLNTTGNTGGLPDPLSNSSAGTATPNLRQGLADGVQESQDRNEQLRQAALQNSSVQEGSVIQPSANGALISTPKGPEENTQLNLTDQEKKLSDDFIHDGRNLRMQKEECEKLDDPNACRGTEVDSKFMGIDAGMVKVLSQMYTMVVGLGGSNLSNESNIGGGDAEAASGGSETTAAEGGGAEGGGAEGGGAGDGAASGAGSDSGETTDYCKYIAVAVEGVAFFQQGIANKNAQLPTAQETAQKDILYKAARSHKERAKTHSYQYMGWGATTACYIGMLTFSPASWANWKNLLKLGASTLMTFFFKGQMEVNEKAYRDVKSIADKLPGKGDCNPITEKDCYCSQPETMNDAQVCFPELHNRKLKLGNYRVACADANGKVDPKCTCVDADACLDKRVMNQLKPFGFGTAFNSAAMKPLSNLSRGELSASDLASAGNGQLSAFNKKGVDKANGLVPSLGGLNKEQQGAVKDMNKLGIPPALAALMAKQPLSAAAKSNVAKFKSGGLFAPRRASFRSAARKRGSVLNFTGGNGINKKVSRKAGGNQFSKFMNKYKKKGQKSGGGKVLNYQDKALQTAQISRDKDRPIFEIISRRYQVSGFKRLDVE